MCVHICDPPHLSDNTGLIFMQSQEIIANSDYLLVTQCCGYTEHYASKFQV